MAADLVIGGVLLPGAAAPKLITEAMVTQMKRAPCSSTSPSTRAAARRRHTRRRMPIRPIASHDVVHYCVANMPGAVAGTSTFALNNATLPFTLALADKGAEAA